MKSHKLVVEYDFDFTLFALISSAKEYKLAWLFNRALGIGFTKQEDIVFEYSKGGSMNISNFAFERNYSSCFLLRNRAVESNGVTKPYLVPELKEYDYFIRFEGDWEDMEEFSDFENIRNLDKVQLATEINVKTLKSKDNLIF